MFAYSATVIQLSRCLCQVKFGGLSIGSLVSDRMLGVDGVKSQEKMRYFISELFLCITSTVTVSWLYYKIGYYISTARMKIR